MDWFDFVVLALGAARLTILITRDDITDPFRQMVFKRSDPDTGVFGSIVDCPDCCGVWVGLFTYGAYLCKPTATVDIFTILAIALAASWIARKGGYA